MNTRSRFVRIVVIVLTVSLLVTACSSGRSQNRQKIQSHKIGILLSTPFSFVITNPLKTGLESLGYIEGKNISYTVAMATGPDDLLKFASQMVEDRVDLIYASGLVEAERIHPVTGHTPIVFASSADLTTLKLLKNQGLNTDITGIYTPDTSAKRLQLLLEIDPSIHRIYAPYDPNNSLSRSGIEELKKYAPELGVEIVAKETPDVASSQQAMLDMPDDMDAIFLWMEQFAVVSLTGWGQLALDRKIPTSIPIPNIELINFLTGYGPNYDTAGTQSAIMVDKILKGTSPADIPLESASPELAINLRVAANIGLEVPGTVVAQATIVARNEVTPILPVSTAATSTTVCNLTITSPLGQSKACITAPCDSLADTAYVAYTDKASADTCTPAGLLGLCRSPQNDTYFYTGNEDLLKSGCAIVNDVWIPPSG